MAEPTFAQKWSGQYSADCTEGSQRTAKSFYANARKPVLESLRLCEPVPRTMPTAVVCCCSGPVSPPAAVLVASRAGGVL